MPDAAVLPFVLPNVRNTPAPLLEDYLMPELTTEERLGRVLGVLENVSGRDRQWSAFCPAHEDRKASLSVGVGDDDKVLVYCFAGCEFEEIEEALNLPAEVWFGPPDKDEERDVFGRRARKNGGYPKGEAKKKVVTSEWISGTELMAAEFPPQKWAVPGIVAEGVTLLVGPPKVGKSWMALGLALAVASGGKALGEVECEPGGVALLALEDTGRRLQDRFRKLLGGDPMPEGLNITTRVPRLGTGLTETLTKVVGDETRLVIVDVLKQIRPEKQSKSDSVYDRDYETVAALRDWSNDNVIPVVVLHHTRKAAADDFVDEASGSSGLTGAADTIHILRRARVEDTATMLTTGRDVEEAERPLRFESATGRWMLQDGPAIDFTLNKTKLEVLKSVRSFRGKPVGPTAVAKAAGLDPDIVKARMHEMVDEGVLEKKGRGRYIEGSTSRTFSTSSPESTKGTEGTGVSEARARTREADDEILNWESS